MIATLLQTASAPAGGSVTGIIGYQTVFVLAVFVGFEVVYKVPSILHTPLMSGSNAIHGIVLVGALVIMGEAHGAAQVSLGFLAVFLATLNVVGGFVVTDRMLEMFKSRPGDRGRGQGEKGSPAGQAAKAEDAGTPSGPEADDGPGEAAGGAA